MPVITNAGGGGGAGSDECTLMRANVPTGLRAVMADSDDEALDGTLDAESSASDSQVLERQTYFKFNFSSDRWEKRTGSRKNNGALNATLDCGESYTIPAGDTTGGKVTANSLASQTPGTAVAADIMAGKTATVNGVRITGIKVNHGTINATLNCGQSRVLPAGSIDGGTVTARDLASQTPGNLAANKMLAGTYGMSNGVRVDGNIPSMGGQTITPQTYAQAVSCAGKYMTGDISVPGFALPNANDILVGRNITIYGRTVVGTGRGWDTDSLYLIQNGVINTSVCSGFNGFSSIPGVGLLVSSYGRVQCQTAVDTARFSFIDVETDRSHDNSGLLKVGMTNSTADQGDSVLSEGFHTSGSPVGRYPLSRGRKTYVCFRNDQNTSSFKIKNVVLRKV